MQCFIVCMCVCNVCINVSLIDRVVFAHVVVPRESGGPSYLAAEPLLQSDGGGGGQQTQPCNPESQNDHGNTPVCFICFFVFSLEHECDV